MRRRSVHFDKEVFIVGDTYYYRGRPQELGRLIERSLNLKEGATQKEVKAKKNNF
jgi:hypothetical protein